MYTLTAARAQQSAFATGIAHARAIVPIQPRPSTLKRLFAWPWGYSLCSPESDWQRVASLAVGGGAGPHALTLHSDAGYRFVKLRATSLDVDVRRFTLEFGDGSLQDLSIGRLLRGCESRPMNFTGREWKGILVEYRLRAGERGKIEVWARS